MFEHDLFTDIRIANHITALLYETVRLVCLHTELNYSRVFKVV